MTVDGRDPVIEANVLEQERAAVARLESELQRLRASEAFRIGHAIVLGLNAMRKVARFRPASTRRSVSRTVAAARGRGAAVPLDAPRLPVPEGPDWFGPLNDQPVTTLIVAWGLGAPAMRALVDDIATLQMMQRHFRPVFVTDSDEAEPFRRYGYAFEHIPPFESWSATAAPHEWRDYLDARMAAVLATYLPTRMVVYEDIDRRDALRHGVLDRIIGAAGAVSVPA